MALQIQWPPHLAQRVEALRTIQRKKGLPILLVNDGPEVSYLTGFEGDDSWALVTPDSVWLITDSRYSQQALQQCPWVRIVVRKKGLAEALAKIMQRSNLGVLAAQEESITVREERSLRRALGKSGKKVAYKSVEGMVSPLRNRKDAVEIKLIEQAVAVAQHGFEKLKAGLHTGMSENEIAALLVYEMRRRGAEDASFDTIVAAGANGSLPHYRPGNVRLENNTALLIDWGARVGGYRSDLTRMIFVGQVPRKIKEIYQVVRDAQQAAIAAIKPGLTGREVDKIARNIIKKAGYGDAFGHGLGHGIGRDIHEPLSLSPRSTVILEAGMVVTVEPGIYLPGIGGVRIEDDVLVTPEGHRVLSTLPNDIGSARV